MHAADGILTFITELESLSNMGLVFRLLVKFFICTDVGSFATEKTNLRVIDLSDESLELIVEDEHEGTTGTTENVGKGSLEEGFATFRFVDLDPAVEGVLVHDLALGTSRLHHHTTTDGVEGIGDNAGDGGDNLGDHPVDDQRSVLGIGQHATGGIVETEVGSAVDDDALHGDVEATVETDNAIGLHGLDQTVAQAFELTLSHALADISAQTTREKKVM